MRSPRWGREAGQHQTGGAMPNTSAHSRFYLPFFLLPSQVQLNFYTFSHSHGAKNLNLDIMFILQMFRCWWHQAWRLNRWVTSACRKRTLSLSATNLRLTPHLVPPVVWRGQSLARVRPINCDRAPVVYSLLLDHLCCHQILRTWPPCLTPWSWKGKPGATRSLRQRLQPQGQVSLVQTNLV